MRLYAHISLRRQILLLSWSVIGWMLYYVYVILCEHGSFYIGYTTELDSGDGTSHEWKRCQIYEAA